MNLKKTGFVLDRSLRRRRGFTLVEILVVVVIIGLLATLVVPRVVGRGEDARRTAAQAQISSISQALEMYYLDNGFYPTTEQGLGALVTKSTLPPVPRNFNSPYLQKLPDDPWGNPYKYRVPGEHNNAFDLFSVGPDGEEGGEGNNADIANW